MNVIIPPKRRDKGSSFNRLVSYISDRGDKPADDDVVSSEPRRNASRTKKAMFDRLVDYADRNEGDDRAVIITDMFPDGRQRLISGGISCETNCFSWETSAAEMNMVAAQNSRCVDPVYHFILSWRENELPTDAQIFESAQYCIRQVGMEGHQYVTAIHQDTDNTHCHVAVNRVNPVTYKAANLWNDADVLQKSCRVLERKYGFIQDHGSWQWGANDQLVRAPFRFTRAPQGSVPLQVYSNTESLYHYAVGEVRDSVSKLIETQEITWDKTHIVLHDRGLGLREQGDGLVVYDFMRPDGPVLKASSIHPTLTKAKLQPFLGSYTSAPSFTTEDFDDNESHLLIQKTYQPQFELRDKDVRLERRLERAEARLDLRMRYKKYRDGWEKPDLDVRARYQSVAARYRSMKDDVRRSYDDPLLRKLMYRVAEFERMKAMAELRIELRGERQSLVDKGMYRPLAYQPWVEQQALKGDRAAVSQLRGLAYREKRKQRLNEKEQNRSILCSQVDDSPVLNLPSHTTRLHRDGTINYWRDGVVGVVDHGSHIQIKPGHEYHSEAANYQLAVGLVSTKSGEKVEVNGDQLFVDRVLETAYDFNQRFKERVELTDHWQRDRYVQIEREELDRHHDVQAQYPTYRADDYEFDDPAFRPDPGSNFKP